MSESKLRVSIRQAVEKGDALRLLGIVNYLRFTGGMNYQEIYTIVNSCSPLAIAEFDDMMQEGELLEQLPPSAYSEEAL